MSKVTSRSRYIDKSRFKRPLKQFGLKISEAKCAQWRGRTCNAIQKCYSMPMWQRHRIQVLLC